MPSWATDNTLEFIIFLALVAGAAVFGGQWGAGEWYRGLSKPNWTPPNWAFPVAWTLLYILIAISGFLMWNTPGERHDLLIGLWGLQLALNALWSYIFFGRHDMRIALAEMGALWLTIAAYIVLGWPVNMLAAALFAPYLVWVSYAFALNLAIVARNR